MEHEGSDKPVPAKSLTLERVLDQSEEIKINVEQAAADLVEVNATLQQQATASLPVPAIAEAAEQNQEVQRKVAKAAEDLEEVNAELAKEVAERIDIASELVVAKTDLLAALHDAVTSLPNRLFFEQRLDQGLSQARRYGRGLAVLFVDLDGFKGINDTHGHAAGDQVLLMVAERLKSFLRGEDTASRWGGDEFACLLLDVKQEADMALLADKMMARLAEPFECAGVVLSVAASIGVAMYPRDGETADILVGRADAAMYVAKGTRKG